MRLKIEGIGLALVLCLLLSTFIVAQADKTVQNPRDKGTPPQEETLKVPDTNASPQKPEINYEKMFSESQKNFERSLNVLKLVATLMAILVSLVSVIVAVGAGAGFIQYSRLKNFVRQARRDAESVEKIRKKAEQDASNLLEEFEKKQLQYPDKEPSNELKEKFEALSRKLELLETLGINLRPEEYQARARDLFLKKKYSLALEAVNKANELNPHYFRAWILRGNILGELHRHQDALEAFNKAIALKPNASDAWNNKGVTLSGLDRPQEALEAYNRAIELNPNEAQAWCNKGTVLGKLGRHEEALQTCTKSIELNPGNAFCWNIRGIELGKLSRYQEALKDLDKAIELKPDNANILYNLSCLYSLMRDKNNSLTNLQKAIRLGPEYSNTAKADEDFRWLWEDEDFKKLTEG